MKKSKTILFFGNERLATGVNTNMPVLNKLLSDGYNIAAIITAQKSPTPSRKPRLLEVAKFATDNRIPLLEFVSLKSAVDQLKQYNAVAGVLVAFGKIVPQTIIDIFPRGIINLHPSLLPKHRGPTPIESTILSGETDTGISLMQLAAEMDAGPVFDQAKIKLKGNESKQQLADRLGSIGANRLSQKLPGIIEGILTPTKQQSDNATYDQKINPSQSTLDFTEPAFLLERKIRAFANWPKSKTVLNNQPVIITAAHIADKPEVIPGRLWHTKNEIGYETSKGILVIDRLVPAGSKEMSAADYLLGHKL